MTLQDWIVILIVVLCVAEIGRRTLKFFHSTKNDTNNPCANCVGGCDLKRILEEKKHSCDVLQKKNNKKSHR